MDTALEPLRCEPGAWTIDNWQAVAARATERYGTPCYIGAWWPVQAALNRLEGIRSSVPVRSWLSFKTHPLPPLARQWISTGRGVEVVSECELVTATRLGCPVDQLLVNGVAKHSWLARHAEPNMRVHFDSRREIDALLPRALGYRWRVGIRCHVPDERDAREPQFSGQFGFSRDEAVRAVRDLRD